MSEQAAARAAMTAQPLSLRVARYALPAVFVLFVIFFSFAVPDLFPTLDTVTTLLRTESVSAILAIALIFPLVIGRFDVSVGANLGLGAILVTGLPSLQGLPLGVSVVLAILGCALVGLINGLFIAKVGINALVTTLGTSIIVTGSVAWYTHGNVIYTNVPKALPQFSDLALFGVPAPALVLIAVAAIAWYTLDHTPFGRQLYAVGGSAEAAHLSGVNVTRLTLLAFVISGFLSGVAGVLEASQLGSGNPNVGPPFLLPAFAAAFLGATAFKVGVFNVFGTVLAVFTVAVGIAGLQLMGVEFFVAPIFQGVALIAAVTTARFLQQEEI
jgi:ribose transport system permease protein